MSDVLGRFVWHELLTNDVAAGISFYSKVVGWKSRAWDEESSYLMFTGPKGPLSGAMALPEEAKAMGAPPCWMTYVGTPDVDATTQKAESLGATVLKAPEDIPNAGRFSIVQDPQGATIALYTAPAGGPAFEDAPPQVGEFSWHELATTDTAAALDFYSQLFGWKQIEAMDMGPQGTYHIFGIGETRMGGMYRKPDNMPAPPHWLPYAEVKDSRRAAEVAKKLGAKIMYGPMEVPGGGVIIMAMDPQGVVFATHSMAKATPAAKPAKKAAAKPAKKAAAKPKKKAAKKAKKKPARKAKAKKPARKARPRKAARKAAKRPAKRKAARKKAARRAAKRPARRKKK